jgi:hypothetical protein
VPDLGDLAVPDSLDVDVRSRHRFAGGGNPKEVPLVNVLTGAENGGGA